MKSFESQRIKLGVNIDHVATLRQLRGTVYPSIQNIAIWTGEAGADQITIHLREDRRHIQLEDVKLLVSEAKKKVIPPINLEVAITAENLKIVQKQKPSAVCLVPERRLEQTTEGGLKLPKEKAQIKKLKAFIEKIQDAGSRVSLFIEPNIEAVARSADLGADAVELHTGQYCNAFESVTKRDKELKRLYLAGVFTQECGLELHAGHGLTTESVRPLIEFSTETSQEFWDEFNIGHSIVCRAVEVGWKQAILEMKANIEAP